MRVSNDDIRRRVDEVLAQCDEAIAGDASVVVLGKPSLAIVALRMGATALWLLGQMTLFRDEDSAEPQSAPDVVEPVLAKRGPGRPRKDGS